MGYIGRMSASAAFGGAMLGLVAGVHPALPLDVAAQPPYPLPDQPAKPTVKPVAKTQTKTQAKTPAKPKPAAKPADTRITLQSAPADKATAKPAAVPEAARDTPPVSDDPLANVPPGERAAIRDALLWSGTGDETPDGSLLAAIKAYQKRNKAAVTGVLTASERADLLDAARAHSDRFGWRVVNDPATGVRIGVPMKFAADVHEAKHGTLWTARHGEVQVETFRIKTSEPLGKLFEGRRQERGLSIESSYQHGDTFFIAGLLGLKQVATRAQLRDGELRGYTVRYDQAMEGILLPVLPAIANAFAAFPGGGAPIATLSRAVDYGTGVVVTPSGYIATDSRYATGCSIVTIPGLGNAERVATGERGIALLRVYGRDDLKSATFVDGATSAHALTLVGIPDPQTQNGGDRRAEISASLGADHALRLRNAVPVAGFAGAPAIGRDGRVLGLIEIRNAQLASAEPVAPPVRFVPAEAIRDFLASRKIALPDGDGAGKAAVVRVICVRE
ncbi:MAG: hypothetical protein OJF62_001497 [Pseudolabrys sp.]|jgi:hypothetical protein|nr:hypothetical protein [Pseudolabrys sp.]